MNDKLQNVLAELAQSLGTSVEKLWPLLVENEVIRGILSISILLVVNILFWWPLTKLGKRITSDGGFTEFWIVYAGLAIALIISTIDILYSSLLSILCPQVESIHRIMNAVNQ